MNLGSHYTVFFKGEFLYGVPIDHVREVIHGAVLIPAPVLASGFLGFFDFRKKLCPVFDIQTLLDKTTCTQDLTPRNLIVVECDGVLFALWIDKYVESLELGPEATPEARDPGDRPFVDQVFRYRGKGLSRLNLGFLRQYIQENVEGLLPPSEADAPSSEAEADRELLCFTIDRLQFGIPIVDLVEVIEGYSVEPLFKTNSFLRGLINLRGQIIACVDLSEVIGLPKRKMEERNQYLLLQDNDRDLALCIDTITRKQRFRSSLIQPVSSLAGEELSEYLLGVIEDQNSRIFVLSGAKLIDSKYLEPYQEQG